jgi:hypothetical protein
MLSHHEVLALTLVELHQRNAMLRLEALQLHHEAPRLIGAMKARAATVVQEEPEQRPARPAVTVH